MNNQLAILPFHEPVYIFSVLVSVIFIAPFLFRLIKLPDVAAFILAGVIIGPYGFNILTRDSSIELLGLAGLLYIMFIAGLELDPEKLRINKKHSIVFGIFTFLFPFMLGIIVSRFLLQLDYTASLLVAIMFSTHTLVAYPIVRKLGIHRDIAVLTTVGGTIITDTLVLFILSVITQTFSEASLLYQTIKLLVLFGAYIFIVFYSYPRIAKWFFRNIKRDRPVHFLFVLFMVGVSSVGAELIGTEAIIGAFVAGLALSRSIPKNSLLMHHVDFVGNILFIPVFLIGIGMLINLRILFNGAYLWYVSAILIVAALTGKWLAAYFTQQTMGLSNIQRNLIFGLSSSHAAATIAVILIGFERQMIDATIFNATVLIILFSSLVASFFTERYGKKMVVVTRERQEEAIHPRILVPIFNPTNMSNLIALATRFQNPQSFEPLYVLSIVNDNRSTKQNLLKIRESLEHNISEFNNLNESIKVITRVDINVSSGILRAAKEYMITDIIFGWSGKRTTSQKLFGTIFDHLGKGSQTLYALDLKEPFHTLDKLLILLPQGIENEPVFSNIMDKLLKVPLKRNFATEIMLTIGQEEEQIRSLLPKSHKNISFGSHLNNLLRNDYSVQNELIVTFYPRKESATYNSAHNLRMHNNITENQHYNFMIIVPGTP